MMAVIRSRPVVRWQVTTRPPNLGRLAAERWATAGTPHPNGPLLAYGEELRPHGADGALFSGALGERGSGGGLRCWRLSRDRRRWGIDVGLELAGVLTTG